MSLVAVCALLLANAFFVAAEFALVKARVFRLQSRADTGSKAASLTVHIQRHLEPYLAACQLGITMASLGLGWIGEPAVAAVLEPVLRTWSLPEDLIHQIAFLVGFLVFSSLHIVLGEQVPKSFAIRQAEPVSVWVAYPLYLFFLLAYPLTWLLDRASRGVLSLFGVQEGTHAEVLTLKELKGVVATSREHGEISKTRARMLKNLIELDERPVGWVMIPRTRVKVLNLSAAPDENLAAIRDTRHSRFPVIDDKEGENLVGIVLAKDLHNAMLRGDAAPWTRLQDHCRVPLVIPERQTVSRAFETLRSRSEHMAIVADEYGQLAGMITLEDLLEEVVGEIMDEKDVATTPYEVTRLDEKRWLVDGIMSLSDAQRELGLQVALESEANTLSGLFMERLTRIPVVGDSIEEGEFRLTARAIQDRHPALILVERRQEP
jgi:CBS domain containing-hemolysin-like protein